jgi:hypothetical protein
VARAGDFTPISLTLMHGCSRFLPCPHVWWLAGTGLALVVVGIAAVTALRRRRVRTIA